MIRSLFYYSSLGIKRIWVEALGQSSENLLRQANFIGPNETFRVNYRLTQPQYLADVIKNPELSYQRISASGSVDTYTGRILDLDTIEEAKVGETVTVVIKQTNAELLEEQIAEWLSRFGMGKPR